MSSVRTKKKNVTSQTAVKDASATPPELTQKSKITMLVSALVSAAAALLAFFPDFILQIPAGERTTIPNLIGMVNRGLEQDVYRLESVKLILVYTVAVALISAGVVCAFRNLVISPFLTFGGAVLLIYFTSAWLYIINGYPDNGYAAAPSVAQTGFASGPVPVLVLIFAALSAIASVTAFCCYKEKK